MCVCVREVGGCVRARVCGVGVCACVRVCGGGISSREGLPSTCGVPGPALGSGDTAGKAQRLLSPCS